MPVYGPGAGIPLAANVTGSSFQLVVDPPSDGAKRKGVESKVCPKRRPRVFFLQLACLRLIYGLVSRAY